MNSCGVKFPGAKGGGVFVVLATPGGEPGPVIAQGQEPRRIEILLSETGVERLDESVVRGRGGPGEVQSHAVQIGPLVEQAPGELRPVVAADRRASAPFQRD